VRNVWLGLADTMVAIHYAFMVYLVVGGFIAWRWRKTIVLHVLAVIWAVLIVTTKVHCPLTAAQNHFRENAGERPLSSSFINLYIRGTAYPANQQMIAQIILGIVIIASWVAYRRLGRKTVVPTARDARSAVT
jgi:hypothetical protein